jgi:5'-nucleotidase
MNTSRPLILLSNDDGIEAAGLRALATALAAVAEIQVIAPDRERSAIGHAISLDRPLRVTEVRPGWRAVSGTPADCVYLGIMQLCGRRPDLCVAGINAGCNLGADLFYSGTVAAAVEGALRGIPAFAVSLEAAGAPDFGPAAEFARALAGAILEQGLPPRVLVNVNVPREAPRGCAWTRLGRRVYREQVEQRTDLRGQAYFWIGGPAVAGADEPGTDCAAVKDGLVSLTPIDLDLTSRDRAAVLPGWRPAGCRLAGEPAAAGAPGG